MQPAVEGRRSRPLRLLVRAIIAGVVVAPGLVALAILVVGREYL